MIYLESKLQNRELYIFQKCRIPKKSNSLQLNSTFLNAPNYPYLSNNHHPPHHHCYSLQYLLPYLSTPPTSQIPFIIHYPYLKISTLAMQRYGSYTFHGQQPRQFLRQKVSNRYLRVTLTQFRQFLRKIFRYLLVLRSGQTAAPGLHRLPL